ncbi:MAG: ABC transporter permease [Thermodesulfobacteriota bacterium]
MFAKTAWKNLWRNRRRTVITVTAMALGLALAIFFIAWGEGVYSRLIDQAVRLQAGHITLEAPGYLDAPAVDLTIPHANRLAAEIAALPDVERVKPIVLGQGMAKSGADAVGVVITGVLPSAERAASPIVQNMKEGRYLEDGDHALAVMGTKLAERLDLMPGKKLVIATNDVSGNLTEVLCRVAGLFETGADEVDGYYVQVPISFARKVFNMPEDQVTQLGVVLKNPDLQRRVMAEIRALVPAKEAVVLPWQEVMPEVASYIRMDSASNWVFQGILLFLVLFTIFNTVLMSVLERRREFAILLAIGTTPMRLATMVFFESVFLGLLGCGMGVLVGAGLSWFFNVVGIDMASLLPEGINISGFAVSTKIFTKLSAGIVLVPAGLVFAAILLLAAIPMRRAAKTRLAENLR